MEQNLTRYLNIVSSSSAGFVPKPGYSLVLFRQAKSGLEYDRIIPNGQHLEQGRFLSRLFNNDQQYVCYAVNADPHLRHSFNSRIDHASHGHRFELGYTFTFSVSNERAVVERLNDDPVHKIEVEIKQSVDAEARKLPWQRLYDSVLETAGDELTNEIIGRQLERLKEYSKKYGIDLQSIVLEWRLTEEEVATIQAEIKSRRDKDLSKTRTETQKAEIQDEQEVSLLRARNEAAINSIRRREKFNDELLRQSGQAMENVVANINTPEALVRAYGVVQQASELPQGPGHARLGGGAAYAALPAAGVSAFPVRRFLDEVLAHLEQLCLNGIEGRRLFSDVLHLIAECSIAGSESNENVQMYVKRIESSAKVLRTSLSQAQCACLRDLLDVDQLRAKLQPE